MFSHAGLVVREVRQQDDVFTVMFFSGLLNCIALWTVLLVREKRGAFKTSILPRQSDPGSFGCLGCDQYRLFDEICSGGPGIDGFDVLAGLVRTAGPVLAQRRIELGHLAGHWFGYLWYPD